MQLGLYIDIKNGPVLPNDQFDFIEENVQTLLVPEADEAAFRERLAIVRSLAQPVASANRLLPADLKPVGPAVDEARLQRWGETTFRRAEEIILPHSPTPIPVLTVPGAAGAKANSC